MRTPFAALLLFAVAGALVPPLPAQVGRVLDQARFDYPAATGLPLPCPFVARLRFGQGMAPVGDLDGDGFGDVVVAAPGSTIGVCTGRLVTLFLGPDLTIASATFDPLQPNNLNLELPFDVACLGDLDGNGTTELAIVEGRGSDVRIATLHPDGALSGLSSHPVVVDLVFSGKAVGALGDLNGDGIGDVAVGIPGTDRDPCNDPFFGPFAGAVLVEFLDATGLPRSSQQIGEGEGGFTGLLECGDELGRSVASLGDLGGGGTTCLAVGAAGDDDGGSDRGAVWLFFLNADGTVAGHQKISDTAGGFAGGLADGDAFGSSVASLGDLDGDGVTDLAVGAAGADEGGLDRGAVWLCFLNPDGTVRSQERISGLDLPPADEDHFGTSLAAPGDYDGDGRQELFVGAAGVDAGNDPQSGGVWFLTLADGLARASFRNAGTNPASYATEPPILGEVLSATVDLTTTGHAMAVLFAFDGPVTVPLSGGQTLLCFDLGGKGPLLQTAFFPGPVAEIDVPLPADLGLIGFELHAQALHAFGSFPFALSNAQDLTLGIREETTR